MRDKGRSALLDEGLAKQAVDIAIASLSDLVASGITKGSDLAIVVVDGTAERYHANHASGMRVLHTRTMSSSASSTPNNINLISAIAMAGLSIRTGMSSGDVVEMHPELLQEGDPKTAGSVVDGGIIVACSGDSDYVNETCARIVTNIVWGLVQFRMDADYHSTEKDVIVNFDSN